MEITPQVATGQTPSPSTRDSLRILFAEDDAGMGWLVQRYLEGIGHDVHLVRDGRQALAAVQRETFDVVLLDLLMPDMDGMEAAARIRAYAKEAGQSFPIIAATSHRIENLGNRWDETLFDAVLSKPVQGEELARVIAGLAD